MPIKLETDYTAGSTSSSAGERPGMIGFGVISGLEFVYTTVEYG